MNIPAFQKLCKFSLIPPGKDDALVRFHEAKNNARPFIQHVEIKAVRPHAPDAVFKGDTIRNFLVVFFLGNDQLFLQPLVGKIAPVAVHQVICEVQAHANAEKRGKTLGNRKTLLFLLKTPHVSMESQESHNVNKKSIDSTIYPQRPAIFQKILY